MSRLATGLLFVLTLFSISRLQDYAHGTVGADFYQFWAVGRSLRDSGNAVYSDAARSAIAARFAGEARQQRQHDASWHRPVLETYSTPLLYVTFSAFSTGNYEFDYTLFQLVSLLALVGGIVLLARLAGCPWELVLALLILCVDWAEPVAADVRVANVARLQLAGISTACALFVRRRAWTDAAAGLLVAVLVLFKPNLAAVPAAVALHLGLTGQLGRLRSLTLGGLVGSAAAVAITGPLGGPDWLAWWQAIRDVPPEIIVLAKGNCAWPLLLGLPSAGPLPAAVLLGALAAVLWKARPSGGMSEPLVVCYGGLVTLLSSSLVWAHYFVLALPALVLALRPAPARRLWQAGVILLSAALFGARPVADLAHISWPYAPAVMFNLSTLGLAAMALRDLAVPSPEER